MEEGVDHGVRGRLLLAPWSNLDANGEILITSRLSTRLTKVAAYRQTICAVEAKDYLIRRINGEHEPAVAVALEARAQLNAAARGLVEGLHWRDFEVLCDLIFARSGWQRQSELGGLQKDTDIVLQQAVTGERAFVQVKSAADRGRLGDYVERFEADPGFQRMFFVCHSLKGQAAVPDVGKPIHVWAGEEVARQAVAAGLFDWLIEKAG